MKTTLKQALQLHIKRLKAEKKIEEEDTHNEGYEDGYGEGFVRCLEMQIDDLQAILKNY